MKKEDSVKRKLRIGTIVFVILFLLCVSLPMASFDGEDESLVLPEEPEKTLDSDDITDEDLEMFGSALISIQQIQIEANQEIEKIISEAALTEERMNEILSMQQQEPETLQESVSTDEMEEFEETIEEITDVHVAAQEEMTDSVESLDMEIEEFNEMAKVIQEDPKLLEQLQAMFSGE